MTGTPPPPAGKDLLRQVLRRPEASTSAAAIEATAAAVSDEVMREAIERRRIADQAPAARGVQTG